MQQQNRRRTLVKLSGRQNSETLSKRAASGQISWWTTVSRWRVMTRWPHCIAPRKSGEKWKFKKRTMAAVTCSRCGSFGGSNAGALFWLWIVTFVAANVCFKCLSWSNSEAIASNLNEIWVKSILELVVVVVDNYITVCKLKRFIKLNAVLVVWHTTIMNSNIFLLAN